MDIAQIIRERRSVRRYQNKALEPQKLQKVFEAARWAPSAHNAQAWKFIVVQDPQKRQALAKAAHDQSFVGQAPIVIAAVSLNPEEVMACGVPTYAVDLAIAVDHMTLQAAALDLGTCWIGAFDQEAVKKILKIPRQCKVVVLLPLGYPADTQGTKTRKNLEEIISYDIFKWGLERR